MCVEVCVFLRAALGAQPALVSILFSHFQDGYRCLPANAPPMRPLHLLWVLQATPCAAFSVYAGGSTSPLATFDNISTAMASSVRWTFRRPLIRWALAPDFCSALQPLLSENTALHFLISEKWQNFTTCERIHGIVRDAFDTWAAVNPALHFVDVSHRCEAERLWKPIADNRCAESTWCLAKENATAVGDFYVDWKLASTPLELDPTTPSWMCSHRTCFECDRADVIVGGFTQKNRRLGDQHAKGRVQRTVVTDQPPLLPTGSAADGKTVFRGWLEFNVDDEFKNVDSDDNSLGNITVPNCWRLDNDICDWAIALPGFSTGRELADSILIFFWATASVLMCMCLCLVLGWLQRLASNLLTGWDVDRDGKLELQEIVYVLDEFCGEICFECQCPSVHQKKMSPLSGCISILETIIQSSVVLPLCFILVLTSGSLVYADGIMKCFVCRDFRASAIHEVGHLLSLVSACALLAARPAPAPCRASRRLSPPMRMVVCAGPCHRRRWRHSHAAGRCALAATASDECHDGRDAALQCDASVVAQAVGRPTAALGGAQHRRTVREPAFRRRVGSSARSVALAAAAATRSAAAAAWGPRRDRQLHRV